MRERILAGWMGAFIILLAMTIVAASTGIFIQWNIRDELTAQNITLPGGRQVDDGATAAAEAQAIERDVRKATGGKTFSEISTLARQDPNNVSLQNQRRTALDGNLLAHSLEDAWIWWTVATAILWAALATFVAATIALVALIFEWRHYP